ncbi:AfsR/SARP family transcriptional regulator [Kitasatospora purpeofusca]|uniref:AfsR/SARP family transcriptional regulator n=1 Tax=Kitasatospora purpeofusca TaxID=67352 RepID=UPI00068DED2B|nr:BTAD domain-containing putative transcriptional regulator [Kitasatospora purpeofusca]
MEFGVLGPLEVRTGAGVRVRLGGDRQERLLAALLLNADSSVPVSRLVDAVWDDHPPATAGRQVGNLAGMLRRRFAEAEPAGPPVLLTGDHGYRLVLDGHRLDARTFADRVARSRAAAAAGEAVAALADLREALALWRGPVLDGLPGQLPAAACVALEELRLTAWEDCLDLEATLGRYRETVPELTALVAEHPLRERFAGQLMRALHRSGRTADALAVHRLFVGRLAEELGLDPSPELRNLHLELLKSEPERNGREVVDRGPGGPAGSAAPGDSASAGNPATDVAPDRAPAPGAVVPRPAQLPSPSASFAGRSAELAALDGFAAEAAGPGPAAPAAATVFTVSGTAGVGKSTLIVQWAHRVRGRFPDGQLYADLHGFSAGPPLSAHAVLARFLRALGVPGPQVPSAPDEAAALYRSMLADRRVLVVLDNAHSAEQVRPLLPGGPRCLTAVTSRTSLAGLAARDGARSLALDLMPAADAVALLDRVIGDDRARTEPAAATELATVCGRLPLALAIAASRLAVRPGLTVADQVAELRDAEDRLGALEIEGDAASTVRAAFDLSYRALPARAQDLFRLFALGPAPDLCTAAAAALCGERTAAVRPVLGKLATAHLLTYEGRDRYRMHDLLRLYAAERAASETGTAERIAARERLCSWYLNHADAAVRLLTPHRQRTGFPRPGPWYEPPGFATSAEARSWCESEHTHLMGLVREAAEHGLDDFAWRLPLALWGYFFVSPHLDDREEAARLAVAAARRSGDRYGEGHARNDLATVLGAVGRHDDGLAELLRARALLASAGDPVGEAVVIGNLGEHSLNTDEPGRAREYFRQSLALLLAQPEDGWDHWVIGVCETNLGVAAALAGDTGEADEFLYRALDRHRFAGDPVLESFTLFYLGDHHRRLGQPERAAACLRRALAVIDSTTENPLLRADVSAALEALTDPDERTAEVLPGA